MPDIAPGLWERILKALDVKNANQAATKLEIAKQTVYEWRAGGVPGLLTLIEIAEYGNTSLDWLILEKGESSDESFHFLEENQKSVIEQLANRSEFTFEEILVQLISEGLTARASTLLADYRQLSQEHRGELTILLGVLDLEEDSEEKSATNKRTRTG